MTSKRGAAPVIVYIAIAAFGAVAWAFRPAVFRGESRRAESSVVATQELNAAVTKQGATAAASVVKIAEANASAPASREKDFIAKEAPVALSNLPPPDPQALLEAERRKAAVLEGKAELAQKLYDQAMHRADELAKERNEALIRRQRVDSELQQVAAAHAAAESERATWMLVAGVAAALYLYTKLTHLSPAAVAEAVTDIKAGKADPIQAIDGVASRLQQRVVSWIAHVKAK